MTETTALREAHSELFTLRSELARARRRIDAADRLHAAVCRELRAIAMLADAAPGLVVAANEYETMKGGAND